MGIHAMLSHVRSRGAVVVMVALAWMGVMFGLAELLAASQARARREVAYRLMVRTSAGAEFSSLYVEDILKRERLQAASWLTARKPGRLSLERAAAAVGLSASLLLDHNGRVLEAAPPKPGLVGQLVTGIYPHLAAAVAGTAAVSDVVPSPAGGLPVVGFAVPFATASGRRVFSGAFSVSNTPLGEYMSHLIVMPGRRVYLVDEVGNLIATSEPGLLGAENLATFDSRLARVVSVRGSGSYTSAQGSQFFVRAAVSGTPWQIVVSLPEAQLYLSLNGASKSLAWVAVASLAIAGLMIILMGSRLLRSRARLSTLNDDLDRLARLDSLTGLRNRRDIEETVERALSAARRHKFSLSVLLIDIDHFKHVNDTLGHQAGDAVLIATAQMIQATLRTEDTVGRWGGEEFLVVLPDTDAEAALIIAERLRAHVASPGHTNPKTAITVTVGAAAWTAGGMDALISRADGALYAGKTAGRNNVQSAPAEQDHGLVHVG